MPFIYKDQAEMFRGQEYIDYSHITTLITKLISWMTNCSLILARNYSANLEFLTKILKCMH